MPCKGCKEKQAAIKTVRDRWDAKALPTISEAIAIVKTQNPVLADRLMALTGELNKIISEEREILASS